METIIITGANRGIGLELTKKFLSANNHVIATCRQPENAADLQTISNNEDLEIQQLDVIDPNSISEFCSVLSAKPVDILINNAGIWGGENQNINNMDCDAWLETFKINTIAPFQVTTALINNLRKASRPRVVAISSHMGALSKKSTGLYAYQSSKTALNKVMQTLSLDLKKDGIIACPVHPGWVKTDMGGANAAITAQESASGLYALINSLTKEQSGRFWTLQGDEHPW